MKTEQQIALERISIEVIAEVNRATIKYPPYHSAHEGYAVVKEELDELWDLIRKFKGTKPVTKEMRGEAVQVAATAVRFILDLSE